jgi:hypothetical protein
MPEEPNILEFDILLWRADKKVALLPALERGIYLELLIVMRLEPPFTGSLSGTPQELARLARCSDVELAQTIHALKKYQTADVHERNGIVTVINRKMNREHKDREHNRSRVSRHRERPSCNASVTAEKQNCEHTPSKSYEKTSQSAKGVTSKLLRSEERGSGGKQKKAWTPFRPGTPAELELLAQCETLLAAQWPENSTFWGNRIYGSQLVTAAPDKVRRIMSDLVQALKDGEVKTTPAQYAMNRWKEFQ